VTRLLAPQVDGFGSAAFHRLCDGVRVAALMVGVVVWVGEGEGEVAFTASNHQAFWVTPVGEQEESAAPVRMESDCCIKQCGFAMCLLLHKNESISNFLPVPSGTGTATAGGGAQRVGLLVWRVFIDAI
jgi:hypothetical protein